MIPIASFIVPVYNEEKHIRKFIDSLLAQTLTDFEVIIIDDVFTDNTPAILKKVVLGYTGKIIWDVQGQKTGSFI